MIAALRRRLDDITGSAAAWPLLVLFGLNIVDELDQNAFGLLAPRIRETFDLTETEFISIASISGALVIMLIVPVGRLADRHNRTRMTVVAAGLWGGFTLLTGVAGFIALLPLLVASRLGAGLGRVMNEPVHASLLADYYPPSVHGRVYSLHRLANPIGVLLTLPIGAVALVAGWKWTFLILVVPTACLALAAVRLREPARGESIDVQLAMEAEEAGEKVPFGEAYRRLAAIPTLKRCWVGGFFLGAALVPIASFSAFFYKEVYGLDEGPFGRAGVTFIFGIGSLIGIQLGSHYADRAIGGLDLPRLARLGGETLVASGLAILLWAAAPWLGLSIVGSFLVGVFLLGFTSYHLPLVAAVAPPRLRSQAFAWFGFWLGLGAIVLAPFASNLGEDNGYRWGVGALSVVLVLSGLVYRTSRRFVTRDAEQAFASLAAEANARYDRANSGGALLVCRGVEVAYDQVQVLFGVDLEIRPGEIVALLGTNGAGKSTLLRAISGLTDPIGGTILFDGRDITHADPVACTSLGIVQVPGGRATFPTLTVSQHLRLAGWLYKHEPARVAAATEEILSTFPRLRERSDQLAGNLSGGEQQMLGLAMAFIAKPKLLMIDELSLGLAPTIVEQLLQIVRRIRDSGTAIILVEQSINVALTVAERAYFMEKGEVRFSGASAELLKQDDIVRSVFLSGAGERKPAQSRNVPAQLRNVPAQSRNDDAAPADVPDLLELVDLSVAFGGIRAVDDCSFSLRAGEILGLIGPNGAGKTTIFDLISGFLTPNAGRIVLEGRDITGLAPDRRAWLGLGRSFQDARLVPSLTVAENLSLALERHLPVRDHLAAAMALPEMVRQEEEVAHTVADLVELLNLGAFRDKLVGELSTGSRRIVDLAMCIAHAPKVLLLDEPSSGIAQREAEALGPLLLRIREETQCALLVIEHDMPLVCSVSERMIALELGQPIVGGDTR